MVEWRMEIVTSDKNQKSVFIIGAEGLNQAKQRALQEFRMIVPQKKNLYLEAKRPGVYSIISDLDDVGEVMLEQTGQ